MRLKAEGDEYVKGNGTSLVPPDVFGAWTKSPKKNKKKKNNFIKI